MSEISGHPGDWIGSMDDWIGRTRRFDSLLDPWPAQALHASIGYDGEPPEISLPIPWHWLYFLECPQRSELGDDGHPRKGDFFPPIANPRRMFVGGRSLVHRKLQLRTPATMEETILSWEEKQGTAGSMTLLTVGYRYSQRDRLCIEEERDFMYLPAREGPEQAVEVQASAVPDASLSLDVDTDPVLLFKFSALTFNGHRIHYDADYARDVEAYPATVVHGPLTALLLAGLATGARPDISRFRFRAQAPLLCGDRLRLRGQIDEGDKVLLTAYRPDGRVAMKAEAE